MIVTIFRSRLRPGVLDEYAALAAKMAALAAAMPGFVSARDYVGEDGERVSIIEFESETAHAAWRDHPRHRAAQRLGRERFYEAYRLQVCRVETDRTVPARP